jgi:hypothetical protein
VLFSVVTVLVAATVLYRTFAFGGLLGRGRVLAEPTIVTSVATGLSLVLTMLLLFVVFIMGLTYLGTITIFPRKLMETWPTVDPAVRTLDHVKVSLGRAWCAGWRARRVRQPARILYAASSSWTKRPDPSAIDPFCRIVDKVSDVGLLSRLCHSLCPCNLL